MHAFVLYLHRKRLTNAVRALDKCKGMTRGILKEFLMGEIFNTRKIDSKNSWEKSLMWGS